MRETTDMQKVLPLEKIVSVLSYFTMGFVGLIWLLISVAYKRKLKYFLMYNIAQSMIISIILYIFKLVIDIVFSIFSLIPFLNTVVAVLNYIISVKLVKIAFLSFSIVELFVFLLLIYISVGVLLSRIFYIPVLSNIMNKAMKNYR